ncbi:hypothetical protein CEXT_583961 [Caerostris extrusa]|uniref:Uncharacterized protein n=1 Tax=Caerostris extrusa TaxID=172846 RepID=A0AAV4RWF6_CAEEX|nr:hypothetical protein CEXT_583961 [Caerostris extrusa]
MCYLPLGRLDLFRNSTLRRIQQGRACYTNQHAILICNEKPSKVDSWVFKQSFSSSVSEHFLAYNLNAPIANDFWGGLICYLALVPQACWDCLSPIDCWGFEKCKSPLELLDLSLDSIWHPLS